MKEYWHVCYENKEATVIREEGSELWEEMEEDIEDTKQEQSTIICAWKCHKESHYFVHLLTDTN